MNIIKKLFTRAVAPPPLPYGYSSEGMPANLFGAIASNTTGFIPLDSEGDTLRLNNINVKPSWLSLRSPNMQLWAYVVCSPLGAVIDRLAEADTNGRLEYINLDGTTKANYSKNPALLRVMNLLKRPNPFQTWEEFNAEQVVLCKIFGSCPVYALAPAGMDKTYSQHLFNLNPIIVKPVVNSQFDIFSITEGSGLIKEWKYYFNGKEKTIPAEDILLVKDGFTNLESNGLPLSKTVGLEYSISNILAAMEADNVLLKKKGPLGIFSFDPKPDVGGWNPMQPEDKRDIQNELNRYGTQWNQLQYIVSKLPIKWNSMSFNLRDLMTKETARQGIDSICDRHGFPAELMSGKNATYENRNSAEKYMYQNNVIPFALRRMARYDHFFGLEKYNTKLVLDYDHLPVLQEDIMKAGTAYKDKTAGLDIAWKGGNITWNEWRELQDMDTQAGMDIYYSEWAKKNNIKTNDTTSQDTSVTK